MILANQSQVFSIEFLKINVSHFLSHDCLKSAAALSFTTLLSIVPIIALLFFSLSQFISGSGDQMDFHNTLLKIFTPAVGSQLQDKILILAEQASKLRLVGLTALVMTVLLAFNTIDSTINHLWDIKRTKRTVIKLLFYILALMAIPILVSVSLTASTYIFSASIFTSITIEGFFWNSFIVNVIPFIVIWLAFVATYLWVPNTKVDFKSALVGAAIAATLFESAKVLLLVYVRNFPAYDLIYGAFAVLPIFCLWIYISWLIMLIGAVLTYNLSILKIKASN